VAPRRPLQTANIRQHPAHRSWNVSALAVARRAVDIDVGVAGIVTAAPLAAWSAADGQPMTARRRGLEHQFCSAMDCVQATLGEVITFSETLGQLSGHGRSGANHRRRHG
jgi:hypothetical protein